MKQGHLWDLEEARQKVQGWYDDLKVKYNDPDRRKEIKDKYNDDSLVYQRVSQKARVGKRAALRHWKETFEKFDEIRDVKITIKSLVPPGPGIPGRNIDGTGSQKVSWDGMIVFIKKGKISEHTFEFSGSGWHIDPCYFGNPDLEDYPW